MRARTGWSERSANSAYNCRRNIKPCIHTARLLQAPAHHPPTTIAQELSVVFLVAAAVPMKVFFYSAHSYDCVAFNAVPKPANYELTYHAGTLQLANAAIAHGNDAICIFVDDECDAEIIKILHEHGIKAILLRCAGYNNVDLAAAKKYGIFVARVPCIASFFNAIVNEKRIHPKQLPNMQWR